MGIADRLQQYSTSQHGYSMMTLLSIENPNEV